MKVGKNRGDVPKRRKFQKLDLVIMVVAIITATWLVIPNLGINVLEINLSRSLSGKGFVGQNQELISQVEALQVFDENSSVVPKYERTKFGDGWADLDGNQCDTRNEILARDLARPIFVPESNGCLVQQGTLAEPYTGSVVQFVRGQGTSEKVQIDHVVALADAWRSGAWQWDSQRRLEFSNDPLNLLAVDGQANYDKGSSSADKWLPPDSDFWCDYIGRQVIVKNKWDLGVTKGEQETMVDVLSKCPKVSLAK